MKNERVDEQGMDRRMAMAAMGAAGLGVAAAASGQPGGGGGGSPLSPADVGWNESAGRYVLPNLPYAYDALEPHLDAQTMKLHHGKHHAGYVRGLNNALDALKKIRGGDESVGSIKHWSRELAFHGCGHINHVYFWLAMAPKSQGGGQPPTGALMERLKRDFGSWDGFVSHFKAAAGAVEGSGWAWLVHEPMADRLLVTQAEKHQNLMVMGMRPLLGIDVWEHAYYLRYQNRRGEYVDNFMEVVNWEMVERFWKHRG